MSERNAGDELRSEVHFQTAIEAVARVADMFPVDTGVTVVVRVSDEAAFIASNDDLDIVAQVVASNEEDDVQATRRMFKAERGKVHGEYPEVERDSRRR